MALHKIYQNGFGAYPSETDKTFWHKYTKFYAPFLDDLQAQGAVKKILEIGVWRGQSIRWLREIFPDAQIYGVDLLKTRPDWPQDERISYLQMDQGEGNNLDYLKSVVGGDVDLIIEDGSHIPSHQALALNALFGSVRSGGYYFLEDVHTSHHRSYMYREVADANNGVCGLSCYHVLLALKHMREAGVVRDGDAYGKLASVPYFTLDQVRLLDEHLADVHFYRRADLPEFCWKCEGRDFDYLNQRCVCGVDLMPVLDSCAFVLKRK